MKKIAVILCALLICASLCSCDDIKSMFNNVKDKVGEGINDIGDWFTGAKLSLSTDFSLTSDGGQTYSDTISYDGYFYVSLRFAVISDKDAAGKQVPLYITISNNEVCTIEVLTGPVAKPEKIDDKLIYTLGIVPDQSEKYEEVLLRIIPTSSCEIDISYQSDIESLGEGFIKVEINKDEARIQTITKESETTNND